MKTLVINDSDIKIETKKLESWVKKVSAVLKKKQLLTPLQEKQELVLVFLNEKEAKRLNWSYREKDYPTDVLSFESDDPSGFGELVMCPQVLKKQAPEQKHTFEQETQYMILHGMLHLLGFDHERGKDEEKKMFDLQNEIFQSLTKSK